tara:strand:- start:2879 stop:3751 length:873 start_codon:yes stop_codon:yes gene_type:complete
MGKRQKPPETPDYAGATREGVYTQFELLPDQKMIEAAARLGTKVTYTDPRTGEEKVADFSGFGDIDQARALLPFVGESADAIASSQLETQQKYGLDFVDQRLKELERSDPIGFQMRKEMGQEIMSQLQDGSDLTDEQRSQVTQSERAAQSARGNIFGSGPAAAEAMSVGNAGFRLQQQRLANAASFISGSTPVAQFGQISGAQAGASPFTPVGVGQGIGVNPSAGAQGANFALQNYGNQLNQWKAQQSTGGFGSILAGALTKGAVGGLVGGIGSMFGDSAVGKGFKGSFG